jgi:hypothetical protein
MPVTGIDSIDPRRGSNHSNPFRRWRMAAAGTAVFSRTANAVTIDFSAFVNTSLPDYPAGFLFSGGQQITIILEHSCKDR